MVHIVFFKFKEEKKKENIEKLKRDLEALDLSQLKKLEVGIDFNGSPRAYDMSLYTEFDTREDLDFYQDFPPHVEIKKFLAEKEIETVVVDYEK
ncbi:Dabb family protein [uncultured Ilyobacter sp.]|uniref:Dabb family protein n=1 Tax=uncultured Ilyobacter sp. TaxID=544433 RepID=UPI0029C7171C|nr:Dabb family protein [uncultured Ilyobacter sp.]